MTILIVDDDLEFRTFLRQLLRDQGYVVLEAGNGRDGLVQAKEHRPAAIISDGLMPVMDGFQLLQALKNDGKLSSIPFIFLSAVFTGESEQRFARSLDAFAFLVKPQKPEAILQALSEATAGRAADDRRPAAGIDPEFEKEYPRIVATALEEKVRQLERTTQDLERSRKELREKEAAYRSLFENHPQPMWVYDTASLAFLAVNDAAVLKYGYTREDFLGMTIRDIRPEEDIPKLIRAVSDGSENLRAGGVWRHRKKDGTLIDVEISSHVTDFFGKNARIVLAGDVTEQKRMAHSLRKASDEWRATFDAMSEAVALLDAEGKIMRCNLSMARLAGRPFAEILGHACEDLCACFGGGRGQCPFLKSKKTKKRETVVFKRGERWFEVSADPILDESGAVQGAVHILQDITARKLLEDELKSAVDRAEDEKAKTESIIAAIGDGITIQDRDFRILYQNEAVKKLVGDHIGGLCYEEYERREERCGGCPVAMVFEDGGVHTAIRTAPTDKGLIYVENTASPLRNGKGEIVAGIEVIHNITERMRAEEALRVSEEKHRLIFQGSPVGIFHYDTRLKITDCNSRFMELLQSSCEELFNFDLRKLHDQRLLPSLEHAIEGREDSYEGEYAHKARTGIIDLCISMRTAPILDHAGVVTGGIGIVEDITERKRLEEQLFRKQQDWEYTFNSITDMVTIHDADYNIILANKAAQKILNLPLLERMKERKCFSYYHGSDHPPEGCPSCECIKTGESASFDIFEPHLGMFMEIRAIPRFDSDNKLIGLIHVVRDITGRKRSEESLARYSNELTALNNASNTLMIITNLKDIYAYTCDIIHEVFDLKMVWLGLVEPDTFQVKPVAHSGGEEGYLSGIKITWDDSLYGKGPTGTAIKTKKSFSTTVDDPVFAPWSEQARQRGYVASLSVPLIYARDKCIGALNFYSGDAGYFTPDRIKICEIFANQAAIAIENARLVEWLEERVQERTQALEDANTELQTVNRELVLRREEAEAASRSKTDFLANMSHELRTPLNAILGFSEIMLMDMAGPITDKQREFLNDISKSGSHLLSLITDILDLSKVEAGKVDLEPGVVVIRELISGSLMMFKEKAVKHGISVVTDLDESVREIVADQRMLKQVLVNLLLNAFKFTRDGGAVIVKARRSRGEHEMRRSELPSLSLPSPGENRGGDFIEISVSDTGIGIAPEHLQKLFQPFEQIDTSLTRKHSGTGLGLSLCRRFIELHGGSIWVDSEPDKGSTFGFIIPVNQKART